jgi:hypothetical protein
MLTALMSDQDPSTRRMYRRIPGAYPACYLTSSVFRQAVVRDLSLNGIRLEAQSAALTRNAVLMIRLWLPDETIDIDEAVVRWVDGCEIGLQIIALSNEADICLARHIEQALERKAEGTLAR